MQSMFADQVFGVDFSGAKDAGKKIWIARGVRKNNALHIEWCKRAADELAWGTERNHCLEKLADFIASSSGSVFGLDFPFGLPSPVVQKLFNFDAETWKDFLSTFRDRYRDSEESTVQKFREDCCKAAGPKKHVSRMGYKELKRSTDEGAFTPFSPYNLRLFKQTFFGLCLVLHPLVQREQVCVLPMQQANKAKPWVVEVCPASTLKNIMKKEDGTRFPSYKGHDNQKRLGRAKILNWLERQGGVCLQPEDRSKVINDRNGDALDSVIAAFATFRAGQNNFQATGMARREYRREGYVYT